MRKHLVLVTLLVTFFRSDFLVAIHLLTPDEIKTLPTKTCTLPRINTIIPFDRVSAHLKRNGFTGAMQEEISLPFAKAVPKETTCIIRYVPGSLCPILTTEEGKPVVAYSECDYNTLKCTVKGAWYSSFKITKLEAQAYISENFHARISQDMMGKILKALVLREKILKDPKISRDPFAVRNPDSSPESVPMQEKAEHLHIGKNGEAIIQLGPLSIMWEQYISKDIFIQYMKALLETDLLKARPGGLVPCIHTDTPYIIFSQTKIPDTIEGLATKDIQFELWFPLSLRISRIPVDDKKLMDEFMNTAQEVCQAGITALCKKNPDAMRTITKVANNTIAEKEFTRETITEAFLLLAFLSDGAIEEWENKVILDAPALGDRLEFTSFMKTVTSIEETELLFWINKLLFQNYLKEAGISVKDDFLVISKERLLAQLVTWAEKDLLESVTHH